MTKTNQNKLKELRVYNLNKITLNENIETFLSIERDYAEPWNKENFLMDMPYKWQLSKYITFENNIAGFIIGSLSNKTVSLHRFMVDKNYRRLGLGIQVYQEFEENCRKKSGVEKIVLKVLAENKSAILFYNKLGYKIREEFEYLKIKRYLMEKCI
ncbi:hypothetical protein COY26_00835 [Candidatus Woesearchaeota archaeon CG_4_10_14_0_2_um_filter_33_10]|nr:MAG: hypothetical protein AUJ83_03515 [Candidatus Woesearchaeota archaeon CG1_02_33_12]PIN78674.1 MAG: hypothetical protein COV14_02550 [Candidatus Woesearchaeota archaeon CG10_big_fil_rev_8_21_14_0_10_33_12]PIU72631.1 MAG: hypothetical protein COS79_01970 [Candidatus Woesearchaeota archaeon CG06_land_8_20_14_3_00_33_13]PIZ53813.1 MAG: hypothetical protein COY26_00835 [Candidatus Woesearchaeota archaeon CG_4_10_14_0_2_um_filter_33_10]